MFPTNRQQWQGKNTFSPDCSDKSAAPWGFDTFDHGTIGMAILDWLLNTWDEVNWHDNILEHLTESFNFYINDETIAKTLAEAWLRDYRMMIIQMAKYSPAIGLIRYQKELEAWLLKQIEPFCLTAKETSDTN